MAAKVLVDGDQHAVGRVWANGVSSRQTTLRRVFEPVDLPDGSPMEAGSGGLPVEGAAPDQCDSRGGFRSNEKET